MIFLNLTGIRNYSLELGLGGNFPTRVQYQQVSCLFSFGKSVYFTKFSTVVFIYFIFVLKIL